MVNCRTAGRKYHHLPVKASAACLEITDGPWFMLCFMTTGIYYSLKVTGIHQKQGFGFWILIMSWARDMHCHSLWLWDSWGCEKPDVFPQSTVPLFYDAVRKFNTLFIFIRRSTRMQFHPRQRQVYAFNFAHRQFGLLNKTMSFILCSIQYSLCENLKFYPEWKYV